MSSGLLLCDVSSSIRVAGSIGDGTTSYPESFEPAIKSWNTFGINLSNAGDCGTRIWVIESTARETITWNAAPAALASNVANGVNRSVMRLRVKLSDSLDGRSFIIDVGQQLEVFAAQVSVDLLAPTGFRVVQDPSAFSLSDLVVDSIVGVRFGATDDPLGRTKARYTQVIDRSAAARSGVVPNGATGVQIYTNASGPTEVLWHVGDPGGGGGFYTIGQTVVASNQAVVGTQPLLAATHWSVTAGADNGLCFVWEITP